jgi:hypothetical protein
MSEGTLKRRQDEEGCTRLRKRERGTAVEKKPRPSLATGGRAVPRETDSSRARRLTRLRGSSQPHERHAKGVACGDQSSAHAPHPAGGTLLDGKPLRPLDIFPRGRGDASLRSKADEAPMKRTDSEIQQAVLRELRWDTRVDETDAGVEVDAGVVTLTGTVSSWAKRMRTVDDHLRIEPYAA